MKIVCTCFFVLIFSFAVCSQNAVQDPNQKVELKGRFGFENPYEQIQTHKFLENGEQLLLVGEQSVKIWDVRNKTVLKAYPNKIKGFQKGGPWILSPDGRKLLAFNNFPVSKNDESDDFVSIWDVETGEKITVLDKVNYPAQLGKWSSNGKTLVTSDNSAFFLSDYLFEDKKTNIGEGILILDYLGDSKVSFWDGETFEHRADISLSNISWYYLTPDGERLFTTQGEKKKLIIPYSSQKADFIDVWNTKTGKLEKQIPIGDDVFFVRTRKMQVSPDGQYLALIQKSRRRDSDDRLLIWKIDDFDVQPKFSIRANPVISDSDLIYSPDGKFVAMEAGGKVQIYELATGEMVYRLKRTQMPDLWMADNTVCIDIDEKKLKAFDILSDKEIYQKRLVYKDQQQTNYNSVPDMNGNYSTETEVVDYTRFAPRTRGDVFLMYSNVSLEVVNSLNGISVVNLITPGYNLKKKKYEDEKLIEKAGWTTDGRYIYAINADKTALELWEYLD